MLPVKYQDADTLAWQLKSACRGVNTNLFYLDDNMRGPEKAERVAAAKRICAGCPVKTECLDYAMTNKEIYGVWGGTSEEERARMRGWTRMWR